MSRIRGQANKLCLCVARMVTFLSACEQYVQFANNYRLWVSLRVSVRSVGFAGSVQNSHSANL